MKKVQITQSYKDMQLNRQVLTGEVLTVEDERAEQLLSVNVGVIIETISEEDANAPKAEGDLTPPLQAPASSVEVPKLEVKTEDEKSNEGSGADGVQAESGSEDGTPVGTGADEGGEADSSTGDDSTPETAEPIKLSEEDYVKLGVTEEDFGNLSLEDQLGMLKEAGIEVPDSEEIVIEDLGNGDKPQQPEVKAPSTGGTTSPAQAKKAAAKASEQK